MKSLILTLLMLVSISTAIASELDAKVTAVMSGYSHGGIFFAIDKKVPNNGGCPKYGSSSKYVVGVDPNKSNVAHVLSVVLTAKTTGSIIDVRIYGSGACFEGWPVLDRIKVK